MAYILATLLVLSVFNTAALVAFAVLKARDIGIKKITRPTTDLADFLDDVKKHGFGVIRLDPDTLMLRRPS